MSQGRILGSTMQTHIQTTPTKQNSIISLNCQVFNFWGARTPIWVDKLRFTILCMIRLINDILTLSHLHSTGCAIDHHTVTVADFLICRFFWFAFGISLKQSTPIVSISPSNCQPLKQLGGWIPFHLRFGFDLIGPPSFLHSYFQLLGHFQWIDPDIPLFVFRPFVCCTLLALFNWKKIQLFFILFQMRKFPWRQLKESKICTQSAIYIITYIGCKSW